MKSRVALGLRAHSGWAALVALTGAPSAPEVADRRRLETADPSIPGSKQPYHAAEGLALPKARALVEHCTESSRRLARQAIEHAVAGLQARGHDVIGCGLLLSSGRPLGALEEILASHALIHAAEGEMFRDVLRRAAEHCGLPVLGVREREVEERAAATLRLPRPALGTRVQEMGRALGPPWTQDQKRAALVAWLVLAARPRRSGAA